MDSFAVHANLMTRRVDRDRAGLEHFLWFFAAAQNCANAQDDFARAERLGHVIVSAEFQTDDSINLFCFCRQHENRNVRRCRIAFQNPADLESGHLWQHQVKNDEIGPLSRAFCKPAAPSAAVVVLKPALRKPISRRSATSLSSSMIRIFLPEPVSMR